MKLMNCPMNGMRNIQEFSYLGTVRPELGEDAPDSDLVQYVFNIPNDYGLIAEWWRHDPSGYVFVAERIRSTDEIVNTCAPSEYRHRFSSPLERNP